MELTGRIKLISEIQTFDKGFKKRDIVLTTEEHYPQHILIELLGDRVDISNDFNVGDDVKISINIRGREWVNPKGEIKYFNSIIGWKIENIREVYPTTKQEEYLAPPVSPASAKFSDTFLPEEEDDDIPF